MERGMSNRFGLTAREIVILKLLADDRTPRDVATLFGINEKTAKAHVAKILEKMGAGSQRQAVALAITERVIGPLAR
jgi:DNA-binding CsgD family transcriptional regulator